MNSTKPSIETDYFLDITGLVCPMTFVRTKLMIEKMSPEETCEVHLKGSEPLENVPRSLLELGHQIVSTDEIDDGVYRLVIKKS